MSELNKTIEALLISSDQPLSTKKICSIFTNVAASNPADEDTNIPGIETLDEQQIESAIGDLAASYEQGDFSYQIQKTARGWRLVTKPQFATWLAELHRDAKQPRISQAALETLAIIAYRQPVTRAEIESIRGVAADSMLQKLMDREVVSIAGRSDAPGRPLLYETTENFLEAFGISTLDELPNAKELRAIDIGTQQKTPAEEVEIFEPTEVTNI